MLFVSTLFVSFSAIVWGQDSQIKPPYRAEFQNYKSFPLSYPPSAVCFNPHYYGFHLLGKGQMSPVPQPNVYYNVPDPRLSNYENIANLPAPYLPGINNRYIQTDRDFSKFNQLGLSLPQAESNTPINNENYTHVSPPDIRITKPNISIKVIPPVFEKNNHSFIKPTLKKEDLMEPEESTDIPRNPKLSQSTRQMIKHLLEIGNKHFKMVEANEKKNSMSEMVIQPRKARSNTYPLPKTVYGDKNEPTSNYDKTKIISIFTEMEDPYYCGMCSRVPNFVKTKVKENKGTPPVINRYSIATSISTRRLAATRTSQHNLVMWHARSYDSGMDSEFLDSPYNHIYGRLPIPIRGYIPPTPRTMYIGDWD